MSESAWGVGGGPVIGCSVARKKTVEKRIKRPLRGGPGQGSEKKDPQAYSERAEKDTPS